MASNIDFLEQDVDTLECPSCGNNAYHLNGVYVKETNKYSQVMTLVNCESCNSLFGKMQCFGKGTDILNTVAINHIGSDWKKIL